MTSNLLSQVSKRGRHLQRRALLISSSIIKRLQFNMNFDSICRTLPISCKPNIGSVSKFLWDTMATMEKAMVPMVNQVTPAANPKCEPLTLTDILLQHYYTERQTHKVYEAKIKLRQRIYELLSQKMKESIDLFLIGSSQTGMGSKTSDTDLCLVIYGEDKQIDDRYEEKDVVVIKLEELRTILEINGMATNPQVIPALVPILKFKDTKTDIEVNININKLVTIQNTHLLHAYSQIDKRVSQLILVLKLWAQKNGIKSAFNKSLTSYSISLMAIHFLQKGCTPAVVPCLQKDYPHLFATEPTQLRLEELEVPFIQDNRENLGQLFTNFFRYYTHFDFNKVISVASGALLDRHIVMSRLDASVKVWQWKCHICIEEPFARTNTSHAVHDCRMFRQIVQTLIDTYVQLVNNSFIF